MSAVLTALVAAAALVPGGCGLEVTAGLLAPGILDTGIADFEFQSPADLTDPGHQTFFTGYEVYYKLYATEAEAQAAQGFTTAASLESAHFLRLKDSEDVSSAGEPRPLIEVPEDQRDTAHTVFVRFPTVFPDEPTAVLSWASAALELRRGVPDPLDTHYQRFAEFDQTDLALSQTDLQIGPWDNMKNSLPVFLVAYATSYGYDFNELRAVESPPTYLGYILLDLEPQP